MVSVPMASSRLPRAVFAARYQPRSRIGAGSDVYCIQEVHVARVQLFLSIVLFFRFIRAVHSKIAAAPARSNGGREKGTRRECSERAHKGAPRETLKRGARALTRESNYSVTIHGEYRGEIQPL